MPLESQTSPCFPQSLIVPRRSIAGAAAVLLPFRSADEIDWPGVAAQIERVVGSGLRPAVNMDTGYVNLIDENTRRRVLEIARDHSGPTSFLAGAFVNDTPGAEFDLDQYKRQIDMIHQFGGTPVIFQSFGLVNGNDEQIVENYRRIAEHCNQFLAFELGQMFAEFGKIYSIDVFRQIVEIPQCIGLKHSSLRRDLEWERLVIRNRTRPEFGLFTGNDLAIDMVMYGSDYLLGLAAFCPELFAKRDRLWQEGHPDFYELNDLLQYLGQFSFRSPTSAYKHNAAMFLYLRGQIGTPLTHPQSPARPSTDQSVLREIAQRLSEFV